MDTQTIQSFKEVVSSAKSVVILLPGTATRDALASALSLYVSLTAHQKKVTVCFPKPAIVGWSHLVGINKLTQKLGNKNFVISLDYTEGSIEKVSYNIEGNKFNLVIEPRGEAIFDEKQVSYTHSGFTTDLIVTLEAATLDTLGDYYKDNQPIFSQKPMVVIDHRSTNTQYGKVNIVKPAAALSELVAQLLRDSQLPMDNDIASNLYDGLLVGSRNFTHPQVSADTFEVAAYLFREGAKTRGTTPEDLPRQEFSSSTGAETPQTPPDWLKPKIFKGSSLL